MKLYRLAQKGLIKKTLKRPPTVFLDNLPSKTTRSRIWFHAASVGELESLLEVVFLLGQQDVELIVTIFSPSAESALQKAAKELQSNGAKLLGYGYSPWEGDWLDALLKAAPDCFVTAKYEAWPDLWASLAEKEIPLLIVGARVRTSFKWIKRLQKVLRFNFPKLFLSVFDQDEVNPLQQLFPGSQIEVTGDPRWDRVHHRAQTKNLRVEQIIKKYQSSPRPWGVLGSVWPEDLKIWGALLKDVPGTVFLVPHRVDSEMQSMLREVLQQNGILEGEKVVLIPEMGFLSEFYKEADWAYVGGGFSKGIHSTIEPAICGIPIVAGTHGAHRFSEIPWLQKTKQLALVRKTEDLKFWLKGLNARTVAQSKLEWQKLTHSKLGSTQKVVDLMRRVIAL